MRQLLIALTLIGVSCAFAQQPIRIKQVDSEHQVGIRLVETNDRMCMMAFWFEFEIYNDSSETIWVPNVDYWIHDEFGPLGKYGGWSTILHELNLNGEYVLRPYPDELNYQELPNPSRYMIRPVFNIYNTSNIYDSLAPYIDRMKDEGKDSLYIGTLTEFKMRHPYVADRLLRCDSVEFAVRYIESGKNTYITLPVEY